MPLLTPGPPTSLLATVAAAASPDLVEEQPQRGQGAAQEPPEVVRRGGSLEVLARYLWARRGRCAGEGDGSAGDLSAAAKDDMSLELASACTCGELVVVVVVVVGQW